MKIWQTAAHSDSGIDLEGGDSKGEGWRGWVEGDGGGNLMPRRCDNGPLPQEILARGWEKEEKKEKKRKEGREDGEGKVSTQNSVAIVPLLEVHGATVTTKNSGCSEKQKQTRLPRRICSQPHSAVTQGLE